MKKALTLCGALLLGLLVSGCVYHGGYYGPCCRGGSYWHGGWR